MGDARYERTYDALVRARDRAAAIHALSDEQIVEALAASSTGHDALLSNVLATEAMTRVRRLRAALAHLGEGVLVVGLDGRIHWMNAAAEKLLGIPWQEAAVMHFRELVDDDRRGSLEQAILQRAARGETHANDGEWLRLQGGGDLCVSYTSAPIFDLNGEPEAAVIAFQDCGARKRSEREILEGRERYKVLFDRSDVAIVSVGTDGTIVDFNAAAELITERAFHEARGKPWAEFLHPDDVLLAKDQFEQILAGNEVETLLRLRHRDGHYVPVRATGIPILVDGEVIGLHGILKPTPSEQGAPPHGP